MGEAGRSSSEERERPELAYCESITTSSSVDFSSRPSFASDVPADHDSSTTTADIFRLSTFEWVKGEFLGHGSLGSVYEGINVDGFFFSVEEISLPDQGDEGKQHIAQLRQEIKFLSQFEDENIVQYLGSDMDESHLHIFQELISKGSLMRLYQNYTLGDSQVSSYTRQILQGLKYLHDMNVVHRLRRAFKLLFTRLLLIDQIVGCSAKWEIIQEEVEIVVYLYKAVAEVRRIKASAHSITQLQIQDPNSERLSFK